DVKAAFLNGQIDGLIHVRPPPPFCKPGKVWRLNKSLYGLKQAPRCWAKTFLAIATSLGFQQSKADKCLFIKQEGDEVSYLIVYVDDILLATKDPTTMAEYKKE